MASPSQSFTVIVPSNLNQTERRRIATGIINHILNRTARGLDKNNKPFKSYSKDYIASKEFKSAGKSPFPVNLKLTSKMLGDLKMLAQGAGFITIGFRDSESNDKAFFAKDPRNGRRQFMGVSREELSLIIASNRNGGGGPINGEFTDELVRRING